MYAMRYLYASSKWLTSVPLVLLQGYFLYNHIVYQIILVYWYALVHDWLMNIFVFVKVLCHFEWFECICVYSDQLCLAILEWLWKLLVSPEMMAMCNRQLVFDKLRPFCVQLSKEHSRKNIVAVTKALEGIDRGCIQDLQEYLLFPLRIILKQPTK